MWRCREIEMLFKIDEIQGNKTSVMMDECLNIDWQREEVEEEKYEKGEDQGDAELIVYKLCSERKHGRWNEGIIR